MRRESPYPVVSVEAALEAILGVAAPLEEAEVSSLEAEGLCLAEDIIAPEDVPPERRSAVDGYAVHSRDAGEWLTVVTEVTAGRPGDARLRPSTAAPIMTGGVIPAGADTVVMVEHVEDCYGHVRAPVARPGENIHLAGADLRRDEPILSRGTLVGPAEIGLLAAIGRTRMKVYRRPRVAVLATGDEVVEPWETPPLGGLRDTNRYSLIACARQTGADVVWSGWAPDDEAQQQAAITDALSSADVLLTSGGVSMGTRDFIKPLLARVGEVRFGRVNFKPGKPLTFATVGPKLAFGLPGYPVSSLVTFEIFVRPALLKLQGRSDLWRPRVDVELERPVKPDKVRPEYQRAQVRWEDGRYLGSTTGSQSSSRLMSMLGANALLVISPGTEILGAGTRVPALLLA